MNDFGIELEKARKELLRGDGRRAALLTAKYASDSARLDAISAMIGAVEQELYAERTSRMLTAQAESF